MLVFSFFQNLSFFLCHSTGCDLRLLTGTTFSNVPTDQLLNMVVRRVQGDSVVTPRILVVCSVLSEFVTCCGCLITVKPTNVSLLNWLSNPLPKSHRHSLTSTSKWVRCWRCVLSVTPFLPFLLNKTWTFFFYVLSPCFREWCKHTLDVFYILSCIFIGRFWKWTSLLVELVWFL